MLSERPHGYYLAGMYRKNIVLRAQGLKMRRVGPGLPAAATRFLFFCRTNYYPLLPISYVPGMGF